MKILHIAPGLHPSIGGPTRSIVGICHALAGQGVDVTLFVHCYDPPPDNLAGVRLLHGRGLRLRSVWTDTTRVIRQIQPDIIHLHAFWMPANHLAFSIANRHSIPVVLSIRGSLDPWALRQKWLKKQLALRLYLRGDLRRAACLHATAEQEAANIRAQCGSRPIVVIPNGVDLPEHLPEREPDGRGARTALFLSRLHPGKGLMDLVQAWHRVRPCGWRMRIVGPDVCGHKAEVQAEITRLNLDDDFEFVGALDDQRKWQEYINADLFVHPSHSENFGISVAEALAAGLPVITTKGAPWSELLGTAESAEVLKCGSSKVGSAVLTGNAGACDPPCASVRKSPELSNSRTLELSNSRTSRCGWWIEIGPDALAETLREAISLSDAERRELGANGRHLIAAKYTWHAIGAEMKAAYTSILERSELHPSRR
jgi:glycosyltransferase involved in cell wall biosynthesis